MKILLWTNAFWPALGGLETQCLALVRGLQEQGHECLIITRQNFLNWPRHEKYQSIPIYRYPFEQALERNNLKSISASMSEIKKIVSAFKPDLIHLQYTNGAHLFFYDLLQRIFPLPFLVTIHGLLDHNQSVLHGLHNWIFKKATNVCCVSNAVLNELLAGAPLLKNRALRIHNGLALPSLTVSPPQFKTPKLLCLGRLTDEKGFDICLGAFQLLLRKIPEAQLIITGDGCEKLFLEKLTKGLGLENNVVFMGEIAHDDVFNLINMASLVIVPSHYEAFGLSALEAMQMARPVIANRVGGLAEIIRHQDTGLLVPRGDIDALAASMEYVLMHPKEATEMGKRARIDAIERFGISQLIKNYELLYSNIYHATHTSVETTGT